MPDALQRTLGMVGSGLTLPLVVLLGLAIRLDSPGPAIYRATRIGHQGRPFTCHKLRTMRIDASTEGPAVTASRDARVTRLGALIRRRRLDELPQLWDVARGAMRLVGPRPEDPRFVEPADPSHREVYSVRPGMTGLAQLYFSDEARWLAGPDPDTTYRETVLPRKLRYDLAYVRHRSWRLDLWILAATPTAILTGKPPRLPSTLHLESIVG